MKFDNVDLQGPQFVQVRLVLSLLSTSCKAQSLGAGYLAIEFLDVVQNNVFLYTAADFEGHDVPSRIKFHAVERRQHFQVVDADPDNPRRGLEEECRKRRSHKKEVAHNPRLLPIFESGFGPLLHSLAQLLPRSAAALEERRRQGKIWLSIQHVRELSPIQ